MAPGTSDCANCINATCEPQCLVCAANSACVALLSCSGACGADVMCQNACTSQYANGLADGNSFMTCVNQGCPICL